MSSKNLNQYIEETTKNINDDRALAAKLLYQLIEHMDKLQEDKYTHKNFGEIAAMYLETLQRSNEQLVKITAIVQRQEGVGDKDGMSKHDKEAIFDLIKGGVMPNVLDGIPVLNESNQDTLITPQDSQHTTIENALRLIIADKYTPKETPDRLQQGVIMKVITDPRQFEYSQKTELETRNKPAHVPVRYKVFVMGRMGSLIPPPISYEDNVISILDDYSHSPTFEGVLAVGTVVFVDVVKHIIDHSDENSVNKSATATENPNGNKASSAFDSRKPEAKGPVMLGKIPEDIVEDESWVKGKFIERIKLKTIISYASQRMKEEAADRFNEMCKAAAEDGIKMVATSGFRKQQTQIDLYNDRYVNKYPALPKNNSLTPNGKDLGVAAYPGYSNHQNGTAVDIDVGKHTSETNRYAGAMGSNPVFVWLTTNASKYGFNNDEGRTVNEPWHWVYNGLPADDSEQAESQKDGDSGGKAL